MMSFGEYRCSFSKTNPDLGFPLCPSQVVRCLLTARVDVSLDTRGTLSEFTFANVKSPATGIYNMGSVDHFVGGPLV